MKQITINLFIIAIILVSLGGISDITGKKFFLSKEHFWIDSIFILVSALLLQISDF
jgi:MFS-type transporter involved in bile tolerance (Atg22 family)